MRQETITLYSIQELSEEARERAFYNFLSFHDVNLLDTDIECILDLKENCIISASFKDCDYSIGDRCSYFKLKDYELDYNQIALNNLSNKEYKQLLRIFKTIGYDAICNDLDEERLGRNYFINKLADKWIDICEYHLNNINETIRIYLEKDYEYQTSMEYFIDVCDCNEWHFDMNGKLS